MAANKIKMYLKSEPYGSRKQWFAVSEDGFQWSWGFVKREVVDWIQYQEKCGHCVYCGEKK
jgi:hypothetical protein